MRIGLLDIDSQTKPKGATTYPNLALCKIAAYHRQQGDTVEWAMPLFEHYDIIYRSKIFNFTPDDDRAYDTDREIRGGTGYDIASRLPQEIDDCQPDYTIYPNILTDTAYGFLTRGCPNKCRWCVVPRKEGAINLINSHGYQGEYFLYTMLNDDFKECWNRIHYWWEINHRCREEHRPTVYPYAQPYRDPDNPKRPVPQWQKDMARWVNKRQLFQSITFDEYEPRKGFKCIEYRTNKTP